VKNLLPNSQFHSDGKPAKINGKNSTVLDLWQTMFSRLESNTLRGKVGEYIVSWALGVAEPQDPWQAFDILAPNGKRIEVKTTAFVQDWEHGEKNRAPKFIIKPTRNYTSENGLAKNTSYNADIYVLCYYSWLDKKTTDVTNLNHWKFWVFSLNELLHVFDGHHSITVKKLESKGHRAISAFDLGKTILSK
jgi:hypothetical protein